MEFIDHDGTVVRFETDVETTVVGDVVRFANSYRHADWHSAVRSRSTLRFVAADALASLLPVAGFVTEAQYGTVHRETCTVPPRVFVDRSILEVYCGGAALTDRLYPDVSATGVELFAEGGVAHVRTVSAWPLRGTW